MPRQGSALLLFAYRHRYPLIVGELRPADSIDEAAIEVEQITGIPAQRARLEALTSLRAYLLARFKDARDMVEWVAPYDSRLALWMILAAVEDRCDLLQRNLQRAVDTGKRYVAGEVDDSEFYDSLRIGWPSNGKSALARGYAIQQKQMKDIKKQDAWSAVEYALLDGSSGPMIGTAQQRLNKDAQTLAPILADSMMVFPVRV